MLRENGGSLCLVRDSVKVSNGVDNLLANKQQSDQDMVVESKGDQASAFHLYQIKHGFYDQLNLSKQQKQKKHLVYEPCDCQITLSTLFSAIKDRLTLAQLK